MLDRPGAPVSYVAHEHLLLDTPPEPLKHPLLGDFFSGFDAASGRFVPTPELRASFPADDESGAEEEPAPASARAPGDAHDEEGERDVLGKPTVHVANAIEEQD